MSEIANAVLAGSAPASEVTDHATPEVPASLTPPDAPKPESPDAARFAALARKEKAALRAIRASKEYEQKLSQQAEAIKRYEERKAKAKIDPESYLSEAGLTYQELTDYYLNGKKPTTETKLQATEERVQKFIEEQERKEKEKTEQEQLNAQKQVEETITEFKTNIATYLETNKDTYELTNLLEGQELVFDTIEAQFNKTKKVMSIKEASDLVEKYFEDQVERATKVNKFKDRFGKPEAEDKKPEPTGSKTLSNALPSSAAPSFLSPKNENDRMQRALAALNK